METTRLKSLLETLVFVAEKPIKTAELWQTLETYLASEAKLSELSETASDSEASQEENAATPEESATEKEAEKEAEKDIEEEAQQETAEAELSAEAQEEQEEGKGTGAAEQLQAKAEEVENELSKADVSAALRELAEEIQQDASRGLVLVEVAGGWQFRTRPENAAIVRCLYQPKPTRFSKPGLETLSIVAYRQPITRVEVDEIRGVDSGGVLKTLCEKNLVRIVGKKDEPGKPMLYGTTPEFLELFQLKNLKDLPTLKDYRDLEEEFQKQQGADGVVTENNEEEPEGTSSILELAVAGEMSTLDPEEESILEDLEGNIKDVRNLEKEIFAEEESSEENTKETSEAPSASESTV